MAVCVGRVGTTQERRWTILKHSRISMKLVTIVVSLIFNLQCASSQERATGNLESSRCYNDFDGQPQRCMPEFVNAAFNLPVEATNTCGLNRVNEYCLQTGVTGVSKACQLCDSRTPGQEHPPEYMTDFNNHYNWTWWQSETRLEGVAYPNTVNLTLHLRKSYDITYVRLRFYSSRPESFAIFKRKHEKGEWIPLQFYSASCQATYNRHRKQIITREDETLAICTDEYSDISPLTGGSVAFSTLEGRPSAYNYDNSLVLQDFVTATDIRIVLTRMNTFGDEVFRDPLVMKSYFYAISDLSVGARCKCNGHASECTRMTNQGLDERLVCRCEHNTHGANCDECRPFFNDRPWARATTDKANECLACDCKGLANRCYFDAELYTKTGHGGHCKDCQGNTGGPQCEHCKENHYHRQDTSSCVPCRCNDVGSESLQCDDLGRCKCKPGVTGDKCDRCERDYYDFGPSGCRQCACSPAGSLDRRRTCDPTTGACSCKDNVDGLNCDTCKPGFFNLDKNNKFGCMTCFCYGHSSICQSTAGYFARSISTDFKTGSQRWTGVDRRNNKIATQYNPIIQNLGVASDGSDIVYFQAPSRYLGDQRLSYNQVFSFKLRIGEQQARASIIDVVLMGSGQTLSLPIFGQGNPMANLKNQEYKFVLNEHPSYQWSPRVNSEAFIAVLANLTDIRIRGSYNADGVGFLDDVHLETARRGFNGGNEATWVEQCSCPEGFVGQFCESCDHGYKRDPANGGAFSACVPCTCHNHSDACDVNTGRCICQHNTVGDNCERCASGFYGNSMIGTVDDCMTCPCPDGGPCVELRHGDVVCTQCKDGYGGNHCDICLDGYYGDPKGRYGPSSSCQRCSCNENIDPNAVGNCNSTTGECLKCIYDSAGFFCEKCLPSYYGDALALPKGKCRPCNCYGPGTIDAGAMSCDPSSGQCPCLPNVLGLKCDQCSAGYWNIDAGKGCEACYCDRMGSSNNTCELRSGQCECRVGVTGRQCDHCQKRYFGFSIKGCEFCNCDPEGSVDLQCDEYGNCPCRDSVEGRRCDRCVENKYNKTLGCIDCPPCYSLVQERVNIHRHKLRELRIIIDSIGNNPQIFNDTDFLKQLNDVNSSVVMLMDEARGSISDNGTLGRQLQDLREAIEDVLQKGKVINQRIAEAAEFSNSSISDIDMAELAIDRAEAALKAAENYIDTEGRKALQRAREALDRFGQQSEQMTLIAQKATLESERQLKEADRIEILALSARNTSREAMRIAKEAFQLPDETALAIQKLRQEYGHADGLYDQTKLLADNAQQLAMRAYQEALDLYTEANTIQLPGVDIPSLINDAAQVKREAIQIKTEAERLIKQNRMFLEDVINQRQDAENLLNDGERQQQIADELLARVDAARDIARNAVSTGEKTLRDANETLQTLIGFDQLVKASKGKAEEALTKVPEIENMIEQAENKTTEAQDALSGAEADANMALQLAQQAQTIAQNASSEASRIRNEASKTKDLATSLKDTADSLAIDVSDVGDKVVLYETEANDDEKLAKEALAKATEAKITSKDASKQVREALLTVNNIIATLDGLDMVDINQLDQLEMDLADIERTLVEENLDQQYKDLQQSHDQVKKWVIDYTDNISQLRRDVDNIEEIKNSLPDGCFKNVELEPDAGR